MANAAYLIANIFMITALHLFHATKRCRHNPLSMGGDAKKPPAISRTRKSGRRAIDAKLDEISELAAADQEDPYDKWTRRMENDKARR